MKQLQRIVSNKQIQQIAVLLVILITLGLFVYYLATHPETISLLLGLGPTTIGLLVVLYVLTVAINAYVLKASLALLKKYVGYLENLSLTGYSSIVNFFGPLQSGPGFRAAYLKQRHNVSLKGFLSVTIIFYLFFAAINVFILGVTFLAKLSVSPLALFLAFLLLGVIVFGLSMISRIRSILRQIKLTNANTWRIGLGALGLSLVTACIYYVELTHVDPTINFLQTIIYTAAANLALFVSLTPGAIGFRESFLLLSQQLHTISPDTVIAASIIDRAFYVVFLLLMFIVLLLFGARSRFKKIQLN